MTRQTARKISIGIFVVFIAFLAWISPQPKTDCPTVAIGDALVLAGCRPEQPKGEGVILPGWMAQDRDNPLTILEAAKQRARTHQSQ